jgi:AraC-like DNA-binding protein
MKVQSDYLLHDQLKQLLDSFTALLGIRIAIFTPEGRELQAGLNKPACDYCRRLRDQYEFEPRCRSLDRKMLTQAAKLQRLVYYPCHGHLSEAIIPLLNEGTLVGFLMIGQFRTQKQQCTELLNKLRSDKQRKSLLAAYHETPCFKPSQIANILAIYQAIADLTMVKGLISFRQFRSLQPIIEFIRENLNQPLSLEQAAELAGKSTSCVSHLFKRLTGHTFKQFQIEYKLNQARALFQSNPEKSVAEVARRLGYEDPFYFSRLFKRYQGQAPTFFKTTRESARGVKNPGVKIEK